MEKYTNKILAILEEAVAEAREQGLAEARSEVFNLLGGMKGTSKRSPAFHEAKGALKAAARANKVVASENGERRTKEGMEATMKALTAFVKKNPGLSIEKIAAGMGTKSKALMYPMQKMVQAKTMQRKGQRRGATYHVKE